MRIEFNDRVDETTELFRPHWKQQNLDKGVTYSPNKEDWSYRVFDGDTFIGGVTGYIKNDWMYIKELIVDAKYRGQGLDYKLINTVEGYAREKGVVGMHLKTFSYQAPEFYKKCGFDMIATFDDMPKGYQTHLLRKVL